MSIIDLIKSTFNPPKNPEQLARAITEKIANSSFVFFKDENIRSLLNFEKISVTEQDRIFNEILVSGITIAILIFATLENKTKNERIKQFHIEMQIELTSSYPNWLKELGAEQNNADLWKELIKMRVNEYEKDYEENEKEIKKQTDAKLAFVFVVAIGGNKHICRGKKKDMNLTFKPFLRWNVNLANEILKIIETSIR